MSTSPPAQKSTLSIAGFSAAAFKRNPTIQDFKFREGLPTAEELPDSDDRPVDSELQELIPGLLKAILLDQWRNRTDWLFGIDLGLYYDPDEPCIAPDGFLSLGVKAAADENLRPSYVLWEEQVIPLLALEVVSKAYRQEHSKKLAIYQAIGILYYVVYAPLRKRKARFQVYKLINGEYVLQSEATKPYWMPEIGLGIGVALGSYGCKQRELLYWYDQAGQRYPTPTERAEFESQRAQLEAQRAELEAQRAKTEAAARQAAEQKANRLIAQLRALGIDPDTLE